MSESIWDRIESSRERWDVLRHPFYERWSAGELSREELARYSGQYRHAVVAIAELSAEIADRLPQFPELRRHAAEELGHVRLWDGFVEAVGGDSDSEPTPETEVCAGEWTSGESTLELLGKLYAVEVAQPAISQTKRQGLLDRYGFEDGLGTAYFKVHEGRDVEHAAEVKALIEQLLEDGDESDVAAAAGSAYEANWRLLDGV